MNSEFIKNINMFRVICMIRTKFYKREGRSHVSIWSLLGQLLRASPGARSPPGHLSFPGVLLVLFFKTPFPFPLPLCPAVWADVTLTLSHWVLLASGPDANCSASEYSVLTFLRGICLALSSFLIRTKSRFLADLRLISLGCVLLFVWWAVTTGGKSMCYKQNFLNINGGCF